MTTATATAAPFTLPAAGLGRPFPAKYAGKCALTGRDVYQGSQMRSTPYGFALVESVALVSSTGYTAPPGSGSRSVASPSSSSGPSPSCWRPAPGAC